MTEQIEGKIPAYSASIDKKTKGEITFHIAVHHDDMATLKEGMRELKEFVLSEAQDLEAKLMGDR